MQRHYYVDDPIIPLDVGTGTSDALVGGVVGAVLGVALIVILSLLVLVMFLCTRRAKHREGESAVSRCIIVLYILQWNLRSRAFQIKNTHSIKETLDLYIQRTLNFLGPKCSLSYIFKDKFSMKDKMAGPEMYFAVCRSY